MVGRAGRDRCSRWSDTPSAAAGVLALGRLGIHPRRREAAGWGRAQGWSRTHTLRTVRRNGRDPAGVTAIGAGATADAGCGSCAALGTGSGHPRRSLAPCAALRALDLNLCG